MENNKEVFGEGNDFFKSNELNQETMKMNLVKAKYTRKVGTGKNAKYFYGDEEISQKKAESDIASNIMAESKSGSQKDKQSLIKEQIDKIGKEKIELENNRKFLAGRTGSVAASALKVNRERLKKIEDHEKYLKQSLSNIEKPSEADEIDPEDLEAAANKYDSLLKKKK